MSNIQETKRLAAIVLETLYEVCPNGEDVAESMVYLALGMDLQKANNLLWLLEAMKLIARKGSRIALTDSGIELVATAKADLVEVTSI